jgi:hypothetical protein
VTATKAEKAISSQWTDGMVAKINTTVAPASS